MPPQIDAVDLATVFTPDCVESFAGGVFKADALRRLVDRLVARQRVPLEKAPLVVEALLERERLGTTAMGRGLALPHLRSRNVRQFAGAVGSAPEGIDFGSLDGLPTRLVILLVSPWDRHDEHWHIMGRVAALLGNKTLDYSLRMRRTPRDLLIFLGLQ